MTFNPLIMVSTPDLFSDETCPPKTGGRLLREAPCTLLAVLNCGGALIRQ